MDTRNSNRSLSSQTSSQRLYEDDHDEISRICRETGRKPAEEIRDLVSEALSARRNPQAGTNEIMETLQQLDERNARLKQGLVQNLREFYAILLETLSASIGARRLAWNYVAYTVLKQSGSTDEQIKQRYEAEKKARIDEKDNIARALEEAIKKMPPQP